MRRFSKLWRLAWFAACPLYPASAYEGPIVSRCDVTTQRERTVDGITGHILQELPCVWREHVVPSISETFGISKAKQLETVRINADPHICALRPEYSKADGQPTITIGAGYLIHYLFAEQARILLVLRRTKVSVVTRYYKIQLWDAIFNLTAECKKKKKNDPKRIRVPSVLAETTNAGDYAALMKEYQRSAVARKLEEEQFLGLMFLMLHEAAHHLLEHETGASVSEEVAQSQEREADDFAIEVFEHQKLSTSVALGGIVTLAFTAPPTMDGGVEDSACRVARILDRDRLLTARLLSVGLSRNEVQQVDQRFRAVASHFSSSCGPTRK